MKIGSVVFQVVEGDITREDADVIVNITNQTFSLKSGILFGIMCENSMCGWKGWVRRVESISFNVSNAFVSQCSLFCFLGYKGSIRQCLKLSFSY